VPIFDCSIKENKFFGSEKKTDTTDTRVFFFLEYENTLGTSKQHGAEDEKRSLCAESIIDNAIDSMEGTGRNKREQSREKKSQE
jgi:hypothetical protein